MKYLLAIKYLNSYISRTSSYDKIRTPFCVYLTLFYDCVPHKPKYKHKITRLFENEFFIKPDAVPPETLVEVVGIEPEEEFSLTEQSRYSLSRNNNI
jgi:hypothetical protein